MSKKAPDSSRSAKGSSGHASTSSSSHSSGVQPTQQQTPPPHQQLAATTSTSRTSTNSSSASHSHHTAASSQSTNGAAAPPPASGLIPRLHATPRSDIPVKRGTDTHCSSSSSRFAGSHPPVFVALPPLLGAPSSQRRALFLRKLEQCQIVFDFLDDDEQDAVMSREREKELKRETLIELVDYVTNSPHAVGHDTYQSIVEMVRVNLFHALPPRLNPDGAEYDPEEDEPILEAAWPHLMIVYELFLCFLDMPNFSATVAANMINGAFVRHLVALFDSEDPRERDYLKTTLHRIYGKIMTLRTLIRSEIISLFNNSVEMHHPHNGIGELLEIMGSIINGFAVPIKPEHTSMLFRALLPLHKSSHYALFRRQLVYCVAQFIEKDQSLALRVFEYLTLHWPRGRQSHVQYRIEELATLLPLLDDLQFRQVSPLVFPRLAECIEGDHYAVVDKALSLLRIEIVVELVYRYRHIVMPIVLPCLFKASKHLGHDVLRKRAHDLLRSYMSFDRALFATCTERYRADCKAKPRLAKQRDELWRILEERAVLQERGVPEELLIPIAPLATSPRMSDALSSPPAARSAPAVASVTTVSAASESSVSASTAVSSSSAASAPAAVAVSSSSVSVVADSLKTNSSSPTESDSLPSPRRHKSHKSEKKKLKAKKKKKAKDESVNKHKSSSSSASPPPPHRTPPTSSN